MLDLTEDTLVCAFRYALGRRTYIVGVIAEQLIQNWKDISPNTQNLIVNEIAEAIYENRAGSEIDVQEWLQVIFNSQINNSRG